MNSGTLFVRSNEELADVSHGSWPSARLSWETTSRSAPLPFPAEFTDKIVNIAPIIRPELKSPDSRNFTDFSVTEVLIDLADPGPLVEGIKVDVYCQAGNDAQ